MVLIFYHFRHESGQPLSGFSAGFVSVSNFEKINFPLCCPKKKWFTMDCNDDVY